VGAGRYHGCMSILALEIFFISLLALSGIAMGGFAILVIARLYKGQK